MRARNSRSHVPRSCTSNRFHTRRNLVFSTPNSNSRESRLSIIRCLLLRRSMVPGRSARKEALISRAWQAPQASQQSAPGVKNLGQQVLPATHHSWLYFKLGLPGLLLSKVIRICVAPSALPSFLRSSMNSLSTKCWHASKPSFHAHAPLSRCSC